MPELKEIQTEDYGLLLRAMGDAWREADEEVFVAWAKKELLHPIAIIEDDGAVRAFGYLSKAGHVPGNHGYFHLTRAKGLPNSQNAGFLLQAFRIWFEAYDYQKICAIIPASKSGVMWGAVALGMKIDGRLRKHIPTPNGEWEDALLVSILREEL